MPNRCVVQGCQNTPSDACVHKFPKNEHLRKLWIKFVRVIRKHFSEEQARKPVAVICSDHFQHNAETYQDYMRFHLGFKEWKDMKLHSNAVPTIQAEGDSAVSEDQHDQTITELWCCINHI